MEEFKNEMVPSRTGKGKRSITVTNSWGVKQAWQLIRKNRWFNLPRPVNEHEFYSILRQVNLLLAEEIVKGNNVKFPERMGELELHKYEVGVSFVDGKLKNTYPVDWGKTWELWYKDPEAFKQKITLHQENPYCYHVKYLKKNATYENKQFYQFQLNQKVRKKLSKNIKQGKVDALYS